MGTRQVDVARRHRGGLSSQLLMPVLVLDFPLSELGASLPSPSGGTFMLEDSSSRGECRDGWG